MRITTAISSLSTWNERTGDETINKLTFSINTSIVLFLTNFALLFYHFIFLNRLKRLEDSLRAESVSEETKAEKRLQHAVKETEFLRLKRSRLGVDDFDPLKVIGRGAFGEVITLR